MQHRMKTHPLAKEKINHLLEVVQTGSLATINEDGTPYITPIHFVHINNKIFFHGLPKGQKIDNIIRNNKVGFSIYDMEGFLLDSDGNPCDTNTKYESIIVTGTANIVEDIETKKMVLLKVIEKYTPHLKNVPLPENMCIGTAVVQIDIVELTGKYYG